MALGPVTLPGLTIRSQVFGPARPEAAGYASQPAMYGAADLVAYWQPYKGWRYYPHYHNGTDYSGAQGTPLLALENGKVTYAGWRSNGGGNVVEVEIRPGTSYVFNHCSQILVSPGTIVRKGQVIARIGSTGTATGNHCHVSLEVVEWDAGVKRTLLFNPEMHMAGGPSVNELRIRPVYGLPTVPKPKIVTYHRLMRAIGYANIRETAGGTVLKFNGGNVTTYPGQVFLTYRLRKDGPSYKDWRNGRSRTDWIEARYGGKKRWIAKAFLVTHELL